MANAWCFSTVIFSIRRLSHNCCQLTYRSSQSIKLMRSCCMFMKDAVKWKICSQLCMLTMHTHVPKIVPHYLLIPYYRHHWFAAILISCCSRRIHASWTFPFAPQITSESCLRFGFSQYTGQMFPKDPKWSAAIWSVLSHVDCWISRMQVKKHPVRTDFSILNQENSWGTGLLVCFVHFLEIWHW